MGLHGPPDKRSRYIVDTLIHKNSGDTSSLVFWCLLSFDANVSLLSCRRFDDVQAAERYVFRVFAVWIITASHAQIVSHFVCNQSIAYMILMEQTTIFVFVGWSTAQFRCSGPDSAQAQQI